MHQQIEVPATWDHIAKLMEFADVIEKELTLTVDQIFLLRLVIEEIATNIVKYGYDDAHRDVIQLRCESIEGSLNIIIRDRGRPFDPRTLPDPEMCDEVQDRHVGGLGLFLVRESADTVSYQHDPASGWNELLITKKPFTLLERLRQMAIFAPLSDEVLSDLAEQLHLRKLAAGEVLYQQGEEGHDCVIILGGSLEILTYLRGEEFPLEVYYAGKIIGEMALIDRSPRSATVRALEETEVAVMDEQSFTALMRNAPGVAIGLLQAGTTRLRSSNQRMILDLEHKNAQLSQAYQELKAAQQDLIRLNRIEEELSVARRIQSSFLPTRLPQPAGWEIAAYSRGAQAVGGDFYDCIELPGNWMGLIIADVCGKGVTAALFVALTRSLLRAASQAPWVFQANLSLEPDNVLSGALWLTNDYITREHSDSNMFITVFYGMLHLDSGKLVYVNAGHNPPLLLDSQEYRIREVPNVAALPLGIFDHQDYGSSHITIAGGDYLVAFSDGITEAMSHSGELYGDRRLHQALLAQSGHSAAEMVKTVIGEVDEYVGDAAQADDMTLLVVRRTQTPGNGA